MNEFGHFALVVAWGLALFGVLSGAWAGRTGSVAWAQSARNATMFVFLATALSIGTLGAQFVSNDYSNQYVWQFSNADMANVYKIAAIWGGMDGSMLLWCLMLTLSTAVVAWKSNEGPRKLMPWVLSAANSSSLFFLTMVTFVTNPFRYIKAPFIPPDGNGLNPLLQNELMAIHPPMLYAGFTTFAIPFAFCLGALAAGSLTNDWLRLTRRWTLIAWGFLTIGIILGGAWAYVELGWGGFWAWDPVENASFLPWLTGSAYLHSVMVQERKNMLKVWNVWLIAATYMLTVFGTFLTRSGVVQSVHAFASTDVGWVFLLYLGILICTTLWLTILRRNELRSERKIESFLSREAAFLLNNLLFLAICFSTLWGVMFPVLSEAITGEKQTVGIPFFNAVNIPLFLMLIALMGIGPLVAWRQAAFKSLLRLFMVPGITAALIGCLLLWAGVRGFYPILSYSLCWFVVMAVMGEFHRGVKAQKVTPGTGPALVSGVGALFRRHRSRYAGYLVHIGVVVLTIGITASMAHKIEREFTLAKGESFEVGRYKITLDDVGTSRERNYDSFFAMTTVRKIGEDRTYAKLSPELRHYRKNQETTTEVQLKVSPRDDIYLVLIGIEDNGKKASMKVFVNPLQVWLWVGAVIMMLGTVIIILPEGQRVMASAPVAETNLVRS